MHAMRHTFMTIYLKTCVFHRDRSLGKKDLATVDIDVLSDWVESVMNELLVQDQADRFKLLHKEEALKDYADTARKYLSNIMSALSNILQFDSALNIWFHGKPSK